MDAKHPLDIPEVRAEIISGLNVSQQVITNWKARGIPVVPCCEIEKLTDGRVTRQQLRPTDFWKFWPELEHLKPLEAEGA